MKDEKVKARAARAAKERLDPGTNNRSRKSRTSKTSRTDGNIDSGTNREDWTRDYPSWIDSLSGGILAQLIKSTKDQLSEAEACIEWYQRKKQEALEGLQELQRLEELARQQLPISDSDSSDEEE